MTQSIQKLFFTFVSILFISASVLAQSKGKIQRLNPISARGEVISVFEGADNIVLIKITQADTAKASFEIAESEVICTFQFGTKPTDGDPKLPGVKAGDKIRMEFLGSRKSEYEQWNYRVFRYWMLKESSSSPKDEKPQK